MIFRQITHDDLGCASYLIGDAEAEVGAVVDPRFDIEEYLRLARYLGVRIEHVLETHNHADHVSGHGRLAAATGAVIHVHREASPDYEHEPFDDGWELALGRVTVRALHTPGHRPEHTAFCLTDTARGERPWAVLTGDSMFVGDVARPDLAIEKSEGARGIFHSLHEKLLVLPDECELWPGHLGGSMCGGPGMDLKTSSTIGFERAANEMLRIGDEEEFVERALAGLGPQPPNFEAIVGLNRGPLVTDGVEVAPLAPRQVESHRGEGALLVDVRTDTQFDEAHIAGAVCIPTMRAGFGTKLAWLADREQPIVLVGRDGSEAREAGRLALAVGIRRLAGYLDGGMSAWREEGRPVERIERLEVDELPARLAAAGAAGAAEVAGADAAGAAAAGGLQLLDVREVSEWEEGHLAGSVHAPWHDIEGVPDGIDPTAPVAVMCASGQRAATAVSLLQRFGGERVIHVVGGGVGRALELGLAPAGDPPGARGG